MGESWRTFTAPAEVEPVATEGERRTLAVRLLTGWLVVGALVLLLFGVKAAVVLWLAIGGAALVWIDRQWSRSVEGQLVLRARSHSSEVEALAERGAALVRSVDGTPRRADAKRTKRIVDARLASATLDDVVGYGSRIPRKALSTAGLTSLRQLLAATDAQLTAIRGISEKGAAETRRAARVCADAIKTQPVPPVDFDQCPAGDHAVLVALERRRLAADPDLVSFVASVQTTAADMEADIGTASTGLSIGSWLRRFVGIAPAAVQTEALESLVEQMESAQGQATVRSAADYLDEAQADIDAVDVRRAVESARSHFISWSDLEADTGSTDASSRMRSAIAPVRRHGLRRHPLATAGLSAMAMGALVASLSTGTSETGSEIAMQAATAATTTIATAPATTAQDDTSPSSEFEDDDSSRDPGWGTSTRGEPSAAERSESRTPATARPTTTERPTTTHEPSTTTTTQRPTTTTAKRTTTTARPTTTTARPTTTSPPPTSPPPTSPPTTAAPASSGCHPSYSGACLKQGAGDYDCAGGTGDGPNYTGRVQVVGSDTFGLDRDKDGIGCENS